MNKFFVVASVVLLVCVVGVATGWTDSDWQMVTYRYSQWHRDQQTWEYSPYLKVNWWLAWQIDIFRVVLGSVIIGFLLNEFKWRMKHG